MAGVAFLQSNVDDAPKGVGGFKAGNTDVIRLMLREQQKECQALHQNVLVSRPGGLCLYCVHCAGGRQVAAGSSSGSSGRASKRSMPRAHPPCPHHPPAVPRVPQRPQQAPQPGRRQQPAHDCHRRLPGRGAVAHVRPHQAHCAEGGQAAAGRVGVVREAVRVPGRPAGCACGCGEGGMRGRHMCTLRAARATSTQHTQPRRHVHTGHTTCLRAAPHARTRTQPDNTLPTLNRDELARAEGAKM